MVEDSMETAVQTAILFLALSAADKDICGDEGFIAEKCAEEFGITPDQWDEAVTRAANVYFDRGMDSVNESIDGLATKLSPEKKKEIVEDLYLMALVDGNFHTNEAHLLEVIISRWGVPKPEDMD